MSDFASAFWPYYIAIISVVSIVACAVLLKSQSIRRVEGAGLETTGHVWDGDLKEWNNPLPRWWSWLFYITIVFGLVYLVLYPGLGAYAGRLGWTSSGQYEAERAQVRCGLRADLSRSTRAWTPEQVAADPDAMVIGQNLFLQVCAQCHASDARGSRGLSEPRRRRLAVRR